MLFGLAVSSQEGAAVLRAAVGHTQQGLLYAALTTPGFDPDLALFQVADLQALLDGAQAGSVEGIVDRAVESANKLVSNAFAVIELVPIPGSKKAAGWLAEQGGQMLGEKVAKWAADTAVSKATSVARSLAAENIARWLAEGATERALQGTWQPEVPYVPNTRHSRDALEEFLADWIVVFEDAEGGPVTELTERVNADTENLTGNYETLADMALAQAAQK